MLSNKSVQIQMIDVIEDKRELRKVSEMEEISSNLNLKLNLSKLDENNNSIMGNSVMSTPLYQECRKDVSLDQISLAISLRNDLSEGYESTPRILSDFYKTDNISELDFSRREEYSYDETQNSTGSPLLCGSRDSASDNKVFSSLKDAFQRNVSNRTEAVKVFSRFIFYGALPECSNDSDMAKAVGDNESNSEIQLPFEIIPEFEVKMSKKVSSSFDASRKSNILSSTAGLVESSRSATTSYTGIDQSLFHGFSENNIHPLPDVSPRTFNGRPGVGISTTNEADAPSVSARHIEAEVLINENLETTAESDKPLSYHHDFNHYNEMCHGHLIAVLYTIPYKDIFVLLRRAQHHFFSEISSLERERESVRKEMEEQRRKRTSPLLRPFFSCYRISSKIDLSLNCKLQDIEKKLQQSKEKCKYWRALSDSLGYYAKPKSGFPYISHRIKEFKKSIVRSLRSCVGREKPERHNFQKFWENYPYKYV